MKFLGDRVIKLFAEALYDVERQGTTYEFGSEFDLLKTLANNYENRLELKVYFSHIDHTLPNRSQTITAFFTEGDRVSAQVGGRIDHDGNVSWYSRVSSGEKKRIDVGLNLKLPSKK
jgi:hypothetical protein